MLYFAISMACPSAHMEANLAHRSLSLCSNNGLTAAHAFLSTLCMVDTALPGFCSATRRSMYLVSRASFSSVGGGVGGGPRRLEGGLISSLSHAGTFIASNVLSKQQVSIQYNKGY